MGEHCETERLDRRLGGAVALSLGINALGLWALGTTSPVRQAPAHPDPPLTRISVGKPLPRRQGLLPSPAPTPTPAPSAGQARAAAETGRLPSPALPPPAYPGIEPIRASAALSSPAPLPTPGPDPTLSGGPRPVQIATRRTAKPLTASERPGPPRGFKPLVLPPPEAGGLPAGDATGFRDTPTPRPTPAPTPTPSPIPTTSPNPTTSPAPAPERPARGESRDAEPVEKVAPEIPEGLKYRPQVRLSIDVDETGAADYAILASSGNREVDAYVLVALQKWKWSPALRDGKPVATSFPYTWNF